MIARGAGWLDRLLARGIVERRFVPRRAAERASNLAERVARLQRLSESDWFAAPPALEPRRVLEGRYRGQPTKMLQWSMPVIAAAAPLEIDLRSANPRATLFGARRQKVWILLHGWLGGTFARDRRSWPCDAMLSEYDLVHFTLPGHGLRRVPPGQPWPSFPTRNPLANAVGLALATAELRQLVAWLRVQGYARIGIAATSIGANIAALYATLPSDLDRLLLDRPLVRMSEPLRRVAARRGSEYSTLLNVLEAAYAPVSPLLRALQLPRERIELLLGRNDGIASASAGEALATHWDVAPQWFAGGHVLPIGRTRSLGPLLKKL